MMVVKKAVKRGAYLVDLSVVLMADLWELVMDSQLVYSWE